MTGSSTRFIQTVAKHSYFIFKVILKLILNFLEFSTFFYNILNEIKKINKALSEKTSSYY